MGLGTVLSGLVLLSFHGVLFTAGLLLSENQTLPNGGFANLTFVSNSGSKVKRLEGMRNGYQRLRMLHGWKFVNVIDQY